MTSQQTGTRTYECVQCGESFESEGVPIPGSDALGYARYCENCQSSPMDGEESWSAPQDPGHTSNRWVILVGGGYGAFVFEGTENQAEDMRRHKASWEGAVARKRPVADDDTADTMHCWNHPLFNSPWRYQCDCGKCDALEESA